MTAYVLYKGMMTEHEKMPLPTECKVGSVCYIPEHEYYNWYECTPGVVLDGKGTTNGVYWKFLDNDEVKHEYRAWSLVLPR